MTSSPTRIAAIQTTSGDDIDRNLAAAAAHVETAAASGARLVVLPECFALMQRSRRQLRECAEPAGEGKIQTFLATLAQRTGLWLIAGTVPLRSDDPARIYNALLAYDPHGAQVARYDKIHLFDVDISGDRAYRESDYTVAGDRCVVQDTPAGVIGLTVCYDLRFPELYRTLSAMGATCLVVPSAFSPTTGAAHWLPLLRARAIENGCYVIAPAQVGEHPSGRRTYGHSLIIDPWGEVLAERADGPGVVIAEIDPAAVQRARAQLPYTNRRADLFPRAMMQPARSLKRAQTASIERKTPHLVG